MVENTPIHVVAEWMSHSVAIATKHYTQGTDEHFRRACVTLSKSTQYVSAAVDTDEQDNCAAIEKPRKEQSDAASCEAVQSKVAEDKGFEASRFSPGKQRVAIQVDAESDALAAINEAWDSLPMAVQKQMLALVTDTLRKISSSSS